MNIQGNLNPWDVTALSEFSYYCCPECVYKSKDDTDFQTHAVINHPQARSFFDHIIEPKLKIKTELDEEDDDIEDHDDNEVNDLKYFWNLIKITWLSGL